MADDANEHQGLDANDFEDERPTGSGFQKKSDDSPRIEGNSGGMDAREYDTDGNAHESIKKRIKDTVGTVKKRVWDDRNSPDRIAEKERVLEYKTKKTKLAADRAEAIRRRMSAMFPPSKGGGGSSMLKNKGGRQSSPKISAGNFNSDFIFGNKGASPGFNGNFMFGNSGGDFGYVLGMGQPQRPQQHYGKQQKQQQPQGGFFGGFGGLNFIDKQYQPQQPKPQHQHYNKKKKGKGNGGNGGGKSVHIHIHK